MEETITDESDESVTTTIEDDDTTTTPADEINSDNDKVSAQGTGPWSTINNVGSQFDEIKEKTKTLRHVSNSVDAFATFTETLKNAAL